MLHNIKIVFRTLMVVSVLAFAAMVYSTYHNGISEAKEKHVNEVVETLEEITRFEKPDFERANNQTFINSVAQLESKSLAI